MLQTTLGRFGDRRREAVGKSLLAAVRGRRTLCLHRLSKHRAESRRFSRFLESPAVSTTEMLATAGRYTGEQVAGRHVLAIMDTTDLLFPTHTRKKRGFGKGNDKDYPCLFLHPTIAVDADSGGLIGLVDCSLINRADGPAPDHKHTPFEAKESYRWLDGAQVAADCLASAARVTIVADREGDIYDVFARRPEGVELLIRSHHPRRLTDQVTLPECCASWSEQGRMSITVPAKPGHRARQATVAVRFGLVRVQRPQNTLDRSLAKHLDLTVVDVREIDPPKGAEPVHWRLLTTHAVETLEAACQIVTWYRRRWIIEQVFRSMKSDCLRIEDSQLPTPRQLAKLALIGLIAAIGAMRLVLARDGSTQQPLTDAMVPTVTEALRQINARLQGTTTLLRNPHPETSLAWLAWIVARLGGWSGYTSRGYRPPGPKTMHHGLLRLQPMIEGWVMRDRSADVGLR